MTRRSTRHALKPQRPQIVLRVRRFLRVAFVAAFIAPTPLRAHDLERTQVLLSFARDGSFVLDVINDPNWLKLRLERFEGSFADRIVLWVDGHEVRPASVEFLPPAGSDGDQPLARYRLRGRFPSNAKTLRWYYGLVIDPYPLTVRRADGRVMVDEIRGDAWSRTIDVSGQFQTAQIDGSVAGWMVAGLLMIPVGIRIATKTRGHEDRRRLPLSRR